MRTRHIDKIVVHHSATEDQHHEVDAVAIKEYHEGVRGWSDIGYHYVVELVGEGHVRCIKGRPLREPGAHCRGYNQHSIGVCIVGNFEEEPPSDLHLEVAASTVADLCLAFEVPLVCVMRHKDLKATDCPGSHFPWPRFLQRVSFFVGDRD